MSDTCACNGHSEPPADISFVEQAVARIGRGSESLIAILQAIQEHYHYLPELALERVAEITDITPAAITGVASFYSQFRHKPVGKHLISVCHGTACHVKGSELVHEAICRHLKIGPDQDTDAAGEFTIQKVQCVGCCTLAPVAVIDGGTYGHLAPDTVGAVIEEAKRSAKTGLAGATWQSHGTNGKLAEIRVGAGSCCMAGGSLAVREAFEKQVRDMGIAAEVKPVGCVGMCHRTPIVEIVRPGLAPVLYNKVYPDDAADIMLRHFRPRGLLRRAKAGLSKALNLLLTEEAWEPPADPILDRLQGPVGAFLGPQKRVATEHCGQIDPLDLDEYISHGGFEGLRKASELGGPEKVIDLIKQSGVRGRGGAGFPSGVKWSAVLAATGSPKYIICNGDEGDPGAFMDRMLLESSPYRILEGMAIGALAVGATEGVLYIRAEYPVAVRRVREAIKQCDEHGLLTSLKLRVMEGAGAFVCGEETALIASIEGRRGMPRLRPPFPAQSGLWGKPTLINNVETWALVPWILRNGAEAFSAMGVGRSKGTKVFALTGKIVRGGLIEVPMGITVRQIVEEIGGGIADGKKFKAVQIGGPSGGCIPAHLADTSVDYESLTAAGAIMGSGGLVVMDENDCMVDIARYFLQFTQTESCGQCTSCRIGTRRLLEMLERLCAGEGKKGDLETLDQLAQMVKTTSICGLGQTAPNPVLTTLRYFRDEYIAHIEGRCPAGKCKALIEYKVHDECIGCTKCAQICPENAIPMTPYELHTIDNAKCTRCDTCRLVCPVDCIKIESGGVKVEGRFERKEADPLSTTKSH